MNPTAALCALALLLAAPGHAQDLLPIETPPQDPNWHPIAPADGAEAVTNPPPMVLWSGGGAQTWTVELSADPGFAAPVVVADLDLPMYNHTATLAQGRWHWRYFYRDGEGRRSEYSPVRSFVVTGQSIPFPVPPVEEILAALPDHPRIYTTAAGLAEFRARAQGPAATATADLLRGLERAPGRELEAPRLGPQVPEDPARRGLAFWLREGVGYLALNVSRGTLENESELTRNLALAYLITGERRYAEAARDRLLWQANFRNDLHQADPAHHDTVHGYQYGLQRAAAVYDSIHDVLTPEERGAILAHIEYHGDAVYRKLRHVVRIHGRYLNSHAQHDMHELLTTALAVAGDIPAASEWLGYLIPQYVNRLAYGHDCGGYSEGHYYGYKWHGMLRCALSLKTATGLDLFVKPRMFNAGRFWLYCMSLNYWWPHFGDNFGLITAFAGNGNDRDGANFKASVYGDRYVKWWANQLDGELQWPLVYYSDETPAEKPPVDIPQAAMFPDVGWASLYDRFYDPLSARLFFKSSPFGSSGHSHQDQNGFVIHAGGQILAIDKGYYGYYGDEYCREVTWASASHNTILVDGEGQGRGIQFNGFIEGFHDTRDFSFVMGDATAAYGDRLSAFKRAVAFIRPRVFVIYDQLEAREPRRFSWQLNAFGEMSLDEGAQIVTISEQGMKLEVNHLLPGELTYRQSNERPHPLRMRYTETFPEQWTAWCETAGAAEDVRFLTLIFPYRDEEGVVVLDARAVESEHLVGAEIQLRGQTWRVVFQRDLSAPVRDTVAGITTDALCAVVGDGAGQEQPFMQVSGTVLEVNGRRLASSEAPVSSDHAQEAQVDAADLPPIALELHDRHGVHETPLEAAVDRWGTVFYFARLDPREQGRYEVQVDPEQVEAIVNDAYDPAHHSRGVEVALREDCELILRCPQGSLTENVRARITESWSGRVINLVRNGGFEAGTPGYPPMGWWVRHFRSGDRGYPHWCDESPAEGEHCLRLFRDDSQIRAYSHTIPVTRPGRYVLTFKAKATSGGGYVNTTWGTQALGTRVEQSDEWREYRVERDVVPHRACLHILFDQADGPEQTMWIDDLQFGRIAP